MERVLGGDAEVYRRLIDRYHLPMVQYVGLLTDDNLLADRVAVDSFRTAFSSISKIVHPGHALPFFLKAARAALEKEKRLPPVEATVTTPLPVEQSLAIAATLRDRRVPADEAIHGMRASLNHLTGVNREAFVLVDVLGLSVQDAGYITDTPIGVTSARVFNARNTVATLAGVDVHSSRASAAGI